MWLVENSEVAANISEIITALAIIFAGGWSLKTYYHNKRINAARWLHELGQEFQFSKDLEQGKFLLDFKYKEEVEPLLSSLIIHWNSGLSDSQLETSVELDKVLNQFEHLLYLQSNSHISEQDRDVYFGYWFGLLKKPERGVLRRYCANFGYNQLAESYFPEHHAKQTEEYILIYGTLWEGTEKYLEFEMDMHCLLVANTTLKGCLYDLGEYPGLVLEADLSEEDQDESSEIPVQLFKINKGTNSKNPLNILATIDKYEACNSLDPTSSEYRRTTLSTTLGIGSHKVDAWIYLYNQSTKGKSKIKDKNWLEYKQMRNS